MEETLMELLVDSTRKLKVFTQTILEIESLTQYDLILLRGVIDSQEKLAQKIISIKKQIES